MSNKIDFRVIVAVGVIILLPIANLLLVQHRHVQCAWIATMILMLVFCVLTGQTLTGRLPGLLIDERNVISLSRFQMVLWTVVVLSAFVTAAFYNVYNNVDSPLGISIPSQVWLAMGISTASMVGTPLILGQKAQKTMSPADVAAAKLHYDQIGQAPASTPTPTSASTTTPPPSANITNKGQIVCNLKIEDAAWADMVTGDDLTNGAHLDLAKVQMLFFTIIIIVSYAYAIWRLFGFAQPDGLTAFPVLDESMIALLGISHSGYLVNKAVPR